MAEFLRLKLMPLEQKLKVAQSESALWEEESKIKKTRLIAHVQGVIISLSLSSLCMTRSSEAQETNLGDAPQQTIHHQVWSGHH